MAFAMMPARGEITQLSHVGEWDTEDYQVTWCLSHASCRACLAHLAPHISRPRHPDARPQTFAARSHAVSPDSPSPYIMHSLSTQEAIDLGQAVSKQLHGLMRQALVERALAAAQAV